MHDSAAVVRLRRQRCRVGDPQGATTDVARVPMQLLVYYIGFMILGDLAAYAVGLVTERAFGNQASLIVFLALYFLFLWISWVLAVWLSEPKAKTAASTA
jgi:hypothetical protein